MSVRAVTVSCRALLRAWAGDRLVIQHTGGSQAERSRVGKAVPGSFLAGEVTSMQTAPRACRLGRRFQPPSLGGEVALSRPAEAERLRPHRTPMCS